MLSLLFGGGYHLFNPKVEKVNPEDDAYEFTGLKTNAQVLRPISAILQRLQRRRNHDHHQLHQQPGASSEAIRSGRPEGDTPADKEFLLKIMKLDPRDRPTAEELLADTWFTEESPATRAPLRD
jgi:hypothetical protein